MRERIGAGRATRRPIIIPVDSLNESLRRYYGIRGRAGLMLERGERSEDWGIGRWFVGRQEPGATETPD